MKLSRLLAALPLALLVCTSVALAQVASDTIVTVSYGDWLHGALAIIRDTALAAVPVLLAWTSRDLPAYAAFILKTKIAEQWLTKAIDGSYNAVDGAVKGKAFKLDVGHAIIADAAQRMIEDAPAWLVAWLGGEVGIRKRILARLHLEPRPISARA